MQLSCIDPPPVVFLDRTGIRPTPYVVEDRLDLSASDERVEGLEYISACAAMIMPGSSLVFLVELLRARGEADDASVCDAATSIVGQAQWRMPPNYIWRSQNWGTAVFIETTSH